MGAIWDKYAYRTSNIPFAAGLSGRNKLKIGESFGERFWVALATFVIVLFVHTWLFGASPFPSGWVPFEVGARELEGDDQWLRAGYVAGMQWGARGWGMDALWQTSSGRPASLKALTKRRAGL
jgi:hypothetical protein